MGEDSNIYCLDDFSFDVLECYIKHGFGNAKIYQTNFFIIDSDEMACMTLAQFYEKVLEARKGRTRGVKMTIDEAIKHCLEVAEEQSRLYSLCPCPCDGTKNCMSLKNGEDMGCTKCAADYRQLAEWLTELKEAKRLLNLV